MPPYDPDLILSVREDLGSAAETTIDGALQTASRLAREWNVELESWLPGATSSLVLSGHQDGHAVVLRVPLLPWECVSSLPALRAFSGRGGIDVRAADEASGTTLLPRLQPGHHLAGVDENLAIRVATDLMGQLRLADGEAPDVSEYLHAVLSGEFRSIIATMRHDPVPLAERLIATTTASWLLHGDLHHFNILRHGEKWVAIDPEGVRGDPAYECAAFLRNPIPQIGRDPDLVSLLRRRIERFSTGLELLPERIWGWALVRTTLSVRDRSPDHPWVAVLRAIDDLGSEYRPRLG